jgi:PAS domain S-box-containing protein
MVSLVLVENEFVLAEDVPSRLRAAGFDIIGTAATGKDALAQARELHPDVVLMDPVLKGKMDGIEAAQQITERFDIPVIFLTAGADAATVRRATETASYGFLVMPFDDLELRAAIEMAIYKHRMEVTARESDRRMRELTESLSEVLFETDLAGNITFINRAGLKEFGYTKEQVEGGMTLYDFLPPDKHEEIRESVAQAVIDEPSEWIEVPALRRDGSTFPASVRASVIVREGVPAGIRGIALNVTEQKRAEQKLEESERRIRELTDALPACVYEADETGHMTFVNATAFDLFGYTKEEIEAGVSIFQLIAPGDRERARTAVRRQMSGENVGPTEYTALRKDGSTFPVLVRGVPIRRDGSVVGVRGVAADITERKRAEEGIKERTHTIETLNRIMTEGNRATDVQSFAKTVTDLTLELLHFDVATIHLNDYDTRRANLCYAAGIPDVAVEAIRGIPLDEALYARVLVEGKPLFVDGHEALRVPHAAELGLESLAVVPLYHYDKRIGALTFGSFKRHAFSQAEKELLIAMGNEVGAVIAKLQADKVLKESERRIRELTDALPEIIFETDANGILTFANATPFTRYGYTKEEVEGKMNFLDVVALFDRERARETNRKRIQGEDTGWVEYALILKDGSTAPFDVRTTPIVRDGVYKGLRGIGIDITERKQFEDELIRERDQAQLYLDTADVIMMALNREGRITLLNRKGCEVLDVTPEQAVGVDWFEVFLPEDARTETRGIFESLIAEEDTHAYAENIVLTSRGEERLVAWYNSRLKDDTGNVIGTLSSGTDVTERVRAEQKLEESERRIREITDALPVVAYEADATGRMTFVNATFFDLFGYTKEELEAGMSVFQLIAPADLKRARAVFRRRMRGEEVGRVEYSGLRKDGSTFNMAARSALMSRDGAVVGQRGVILDVTEQKRAEERVKEHTHTIETLNRIMTEGNRATDVRSFVEAATKLACELMHFDIGGIYLIDADARYATLQYGQGLPETVRDAIEKIPYHDAPFSAILIDGDPLFAEDYVTFLPQHAPLGVASLASVPLYSRDTIIGALNVGSAIRHTFSQTEKALLVAIGNEAGTVIAKLQADASVRAALKEKETLLKEIHHRVKNNMQVVSSLMSLQADRATNVEAQAVLTASQSQIRSMALIHEKLYSSGTLSEIEFADYVGSLIKELLQMYHVAPDAVTITTDIEDVRFGVDIAMPCALILNELVSNCLKYAFPDGRVGEVIVGMQYADGTYTLTVADNGVGFPADVDFRATGSLGMQLVTALVEQLDGTIDMNRENGTSFVISFSPAP